MQTLDRDEVSTTVAAPPESVYALVSDVTRTAEFSPEVVSCRWLDGATGPAVGARFEAVNVSTAGRTWTNRPVVTAAEPGREFAFTRTEPFAGSIAWRYRFENVPEGTRVVESYEVERPVTRLGWFVIEKVFRSGNRREELRAGMRTTLERLRALAEAELPAPRGPEGA
jgi:ligand-binding SRPBCC domain-containing protein